MGFGSSQTHEAGLYPQESLRPQHCSQRSRTWPFRAVPRLDWIHSAQHCDSHDPHAIPMQSPNPYPRHHESSKPWAWDAWGRNWQSFALLCERVYSLRLSHIMGFVRVRMGATVWKEEIFAPSRKTHLPIGIKHNRSINLNTTSLAAKPCKTMDRQH